MAEEDGQPDSSNGHRSLGLDDFTWALLDPGRGPQLLAIPWRSATSLVRPRLIARLDAGLRKPLTLISAPPDYGKTTHISESGTRTERRVVGWRLTPTTTILCDSGHTWRRWTSHGKVPCMGSFPYTWKYRLEEFLPWKLEARGKPLEPPPKSMPSPVGHAYKKRAHSPNHIHHHSPPRRPKIRQKWGFSTMAELRKEQVILEKQNKQN